MRHRIIDMFLKANTCAEQHREFVRKQLRLILLSGYSPMSFFMKDYRKYFYMAELLAVVDLSLVRPSTKPPIAFIECMLLCIMDFPKASANSAVGCLQTVKMGVQYSLWGGSVMNLGTERHKKQYFDAIDKFKIPGATTSCYHCTVSSPQALHFLCLTWLHSSAEASITVLNCAHVQLVLASEVRSSTACLVSILAASFCRRARCGASVMLMCSLCLHQVSKAILPVCRLLLHD